MVCCGLRHPAGHVITNYHVITDASEIQVTFQGGTEYSAKVVGFDTDKDIAVLKVCRDKSCVASCSITSLLLLAAETTWDSLAVTWLAEDLACC